MIKGRNAKENVVVGLSVVVLFGKARVHKATVLVKDRFGKSRGARREIDCSVVVICNGDGRLVGRAENYVVLEAVCKGGAVLADIEKMLYVGDPVAYLFDSSDKFGAEDKNRNVSLGKTVFYLLGGVSEV